MEKDNCIALLREKAAALGRLPRREDCTQEEVQHIKAKLGPWPRALEAAGLKEPSCAYLNRRESRLEKRERAKQRRAAGGKRL